MKNTALIVARIKKDMTQTSLAEKVGVTRQTICLIERGDYNPSIHLCIRICEELSVTLDDLFWKEDHDEKKDQDR